MSDATDSPDTQSWHAKTHQSPESGRSFAVVIVGSVSEPERVGQCALLQTDPGEYQLGRTGNMPWVEQRPGQSRTAGTLGDSQLSRRQIVFEVTSKHLRAKNLGRLPLRLNGRPVTECELLPGDTLELADRYLLLITVRPVHLDGDPSVRHRFGKPDANGIVGESAAAWSLRHQVAFAARRDAHVLVLGASGTGKELVANGLHRLSRRSSRPIVSRNAATIPESLADAELFGNLAGYPNPRMVARDGLVGEADGSTLFLDEFGELPLAQQARLLRVLDSGEYTRLGDAVPRTSDLRLVAATNRDPADLKHDVVARFALRIHVANLNDRREDVPLLVVHLLRRIAVNDSEIARRFFPNGDATGHARISMGLLRQLVCHAYTTHVRELEFLLWQSIAVPGTDTLDVVRVSESLPTARISPPPAADGLAPYLLEPEVIQEALARHGGRQEPVWRELGLSSRHVLARLIKKHGLTITRR